MILMFQFIGCKFQSSIYFSLELITIGYTYHAVHYLPSYPAVLEYKNVSPQCATIILQKRPWLQSGRQCLGSKSVYFLPNNLVRSGSAIIFLDPVSIRDSDPSFWPYINSFKVAATCIFSGEACKD